MARFIYSVILPVSKRTVQLTEFTFTKLKDLVKNITNENNDIILLSFNDIIKEHCTDNVDDLTVIDKLYILLTIRSVCVSPVLELIITCPKTKKQFNGTINISNILNTLYSFQYEQKEISYQNNLKVTYNLPKSLYINQNAMDASETIINCISLGDSRFYDITAEAINKLPAVVLNDVKTYANNTFLALKELELINLPSPFSRDKEDATIITANVFDNSVLEFLKLCFNRDLMSFYKTEYFLMKQFRMNYETMSNLTPVEINLYINLYKEEQAEQEKAEKQSSSPQNGPNIGQFKPVA